MGTGILTDDENDRRKHAIEQELLAGRAPVGSKLANRSAVRQAAAKLGIPPGTLLTWVQTQEERAIRNKRHWLPDWSLFRPKSGKASSANHNETVKGPAVEPEPEKQEDTAPVIDYTETVRRILLKKGRMSVEELAQRAKGDPFDILAALSNLRMEGVTIGEAGGLVEIIRAPSPAYVSGREPVRIFTDENNRLVFGAMGDNHAASKYARWDVVEDLFDRFEQAGVRHVFHTGNWIDGEATFNRYDLDVHGLDGQCLELARRWPRKPDMQTFAVWGDDHEGWYAQREGIDVGRYCQSTFLHEGREDWHDLGFMEADVEIVNANTGKVAKMKVVHPGGGSSYAISYRPQKIVESFEGGQKPAILLLGHYHKMECANVRNVWALQTGCAQDQTPFMRKKSLEAHVGGAIVEIEQDPETGAIISFKPEMRRYFYKDYYSGSSQWSKHGPVDLPIRSPNGV